MNLDRNVYTENGYKDRNDYLKNLSDKYCLDEELVTMIADMYGADEDFDGLVSTLEDIA